MELSLQATSLNVIVGNIMDALDSPAFKEFKLECAVEKHTDNLKIVLSRVATSLQVVLEHKGEADEQMDLQHLEDVLCDIEDTVDEPEALEVKVHHLFQSSSDLAISTMLKKFVEKLEEVDREMNDKKGRLTEETKSITEILEKSNHLNTVPRISDYGRDFYGRDLDAETVTSHLLSEEYQCTDRNVSILPIIGFGGVGKTTLVKQIYDDIKIKSHFQTRIWVTVCGYSDERSIIKEILKSVSRGRPCEIVIIEMLREKLKEKLLGKKFLLVLDDLWHEDMNDWESICCLLEVGKKGSRVVVTTRSEEVAKYVGTMKAYNLEGLSSEDSWHLIKDLAFQDNKAMQENNNQLTEIEEICKNISCKLRGSPSAIKIFSELLKIDKLDKHEIEQLQKLEKDNDYGMGRLLKMFYHCLPLQLKQCLIYCSIFPEDHKFRRTSLIHIWVALGFVRSQEGKLDEETASDYFNFLCQMSFFSCCRGRYVLHGSIAMMMHLMFEDPYHGSGNKSALATSKSALHLALSTSSGLNLTNFVKLYKINHLRTLVYLKRYKTGFDYIGDDTIEKLSSLRVLDLSHSDIREVPNSVEYLRHLRYLNLSFCRLERLPDSICRLSRLQTLNLTGCHMLTGLPREMSKLTNLRCLKAAPELISTVAGIGRLTMLQKLEEFKVAKKPGFKIEELAYLKHLRGSLCIRNLENVTSKTEAETETEIEAEEDSLISKTRLESLKLVWTAQQRDSSNPKEHKDVLSKLRPHDKLKHLHIENYGGESGPEWLTDCNLSNMESLGLKNCYRWRELPAWRHLQLLRFLALDGLDGVQTAGSNFQGNTNFQNLEELRLTRMVNWEEWQGVNDAPLFPRLSVLVIAECPKLTVLPQLPCSLTSMRIERVGLETLPDFCTCKGVVPSLVSLFISDCEKLTTLGAGLLQHDLRDLQVVTITNCIKLHSVPLSWFQALMSLKSLTVKNCPKLNDDPRPTLLQMEARQSNGGSSTDGISNSLFNWLKSATSLSSVSITKDYLGVAECTNQALQYLTLLEALSIHGESKSKSKDDSTSAISLNYEANRGDANLRENKFSKANIKIVQMQCDLNDTTTGKFIKHFKFLCRLEIHDCLAITSISGKVLCSLKALKKLSVSCCERLSSLGVQVLIELESLVIQRCSKLKSFVDENTKDKSLKKLESLQNMVIFGCTSLASLPVLHDLPKLEYLHLEECPAIRCLPDKGVPDSLKELVIKECPTLVKSVAGKDSAKIADVPYKFIDQC
ncbi:putative disease resistance protein RGA3 [Curcuma longa]|uniref:putative disease resistance protein RGA3 n=1 Tax=Curcuma longa TaxID=136217 RepID=UPI003D9DBD61